MRTLGIVTLTRLDNGVNENIGPDASQKVYNHSPDGFNFGYHGSGPAQLALAILVDFFSRNNILPTLAAQFHQEFKRQFIAPMKAGGSISDDEIEMFIANQNAKSPPP